MKLSRFLFACFIVFTLGITSLWGQSNQKISTQEAPFNLTQNQTQELSRTLKEYSVFSASGAELKSMIQDDDVINTEIVLPYVGKQPIFLERSEMMTSESVLTASSGEVVPFEERAIPLKGIIGTVGDDMRLTINDGFIKGIYFLDGKTYHIQPIQDFIDINTELYVTYEISDVIAPKNVSCGIDNMQMWADNYKHKHGLDEPEVHEQQQQVQVVDCYIVEMAIAADYSFYVDNGNNLTAVENDLIARMNNSQTNYDDEFEDALIFQIVTMFIVDQSGQDPWTSSTDSGALLNSFRSWANGGGFGTSGYDDAGLWTDRNFDGSTIGLAWVNSICYSYRYHVLQDFSTNAELLRVLWSHEMGHNWSLNHDASGSNFIMAPAVSGATAWSSTSINAMDNKVDAVDPQSGGCLSHCPPANPIVTDFTSDIQQVCGGSTVQFYDLSTNEPSSWSWTFPGGSPTTSSDRSPLIQYNIPGTYEVSLQSSNANTSDSKTVTGFITVGSSGESHVMFEEFENGLGAWTESGSNGTSWTTIGTNLGSGDFSLFMDNYNNTSGDIDELESPGFTTAGYQSMRVEMMYAYTNQSNQHDSLSLQISTDNGQSWAYVEGRAENGSNNFRTAPPQGSPFTVQDRAHWCYDNSNGYARCLSFDISAYVGHYDVKIRLRSVSDGGNNLYIDHVAVIGDCFLLDPPVADFEADVVEGCAPLEVQFTDLSTNLPETWVWTFVGGNPATSNEQHPVVNYPGPGTYDVILEVTNPSGNSVEFKQSYITVLPEPIADFTHVVNGFTVDFTNTSFGGSTFLWDFGDGNTSTEENPSHTYSAGGDYDVMLTITGDCGTDDITETVSISAVPVADFTFDPASGCATLEVQYTDASSGATSWQWSFPGGNPATSTMQNPVVTYDTPGFYDATLVVTNPTGTDMIEKTNIIEVKNEPTASYTFARNGFTVDFDATGTNVNSYLWDFGDGGNSTMEDPSHTYGSTGTYDVVLTAYGDCDTIVITQSVTIADVPDPDFTASATEACVPATIQFTDMSVNATSWQWQFEGGTPTTSTQQNPSVVYNAVGVFDVTLIATNAEGSETIVKSDYITIIDKPIVDFTVNQNDLVITLDNLTQNGDSYVWDFGDGNTSTAFEPTHTYATEGRYVVSLTATNVCGSSTITRTVGVGNFPNASFTVGEQLGCVPFEVQYEDLSSNADSYEWYFEGGTPSTSTNSEPLVVYNTTGTFDVQLIVENGLGRDTILHEDYIIVGDKPVADFDFTVNGFDVDFNNLSTGNVDTYLWIFGDGETSSLENPSHTYVEGEYDAMLIVSNECGSDTIVKAISLINLQAGFTVGNQSGCVPFVVAYTDNSSGSVTSWNWTFEGGTPATSNERNPEITYNTPGTFDVSLTVSDGVESSTVDMEDFIVVGDKPTADFTYTSNDRTYDFENLSTGGTTYSWNFGDGATSTLENPQHTYGDDENKQVTLIVTNACGSDTIVKTVGSGLPPVARFSVDMNVVCAGNSVTFMDESEGDPDSYSWSFEGGTPSSSTERNPTVTYDVPGRYTVELIVENSNGSDENIRVDYISVIDVPVADFDVSINGRSVEFANQSLYGTGYMWFFGNGESNNQTNPTIEYENRTETYEVMLIAINMCGRDTIVKSLDIEGTNATYETSQAFKIFPNPFSDEVYIHTLSDLEISKIEVFSIDGRMIKIQAVETLREGQYALKLSDLVSGSYFLKLYSDSDVYYSKLLKH